MLILILFERDYFSSEESAQKYVSKIYDFIEIDLINFPHKITPVELAHLGSKYAFYKANNQTTWYVFFENKDNLYLVTYIIKNHIKEANLLQSS